MPHPRLRFHGAAGEVTGSMHLVEAAGLTAPSGLDGQSLVPLLKGESQQGREYVFTQIDYTAGGPVKPMRCVQDKRYGYIFNAFSDGTFEYRNNNEGQTFKAMIEDPLAMLL